jgi:2-dehydro-3-deoxyphosphogluconate aldolase / (4S)-4-hydroxy-2-oxoglutarate aldolase
VTEQTTERLMDRLRADRALTVVPVFLGAFTPTEVAEAVDLGAAAVKIFPAAFAAALRATGEQ